MNNKESSNAVLSGLVSELADELAQLVVQEHKLLQTELKQITELVDAAVHELSNITIQLKHSTDSIMVSRAESDSQTLEDAQDNLQLLSEQIGISTGETVRTLQFGDILKQLTGHVLNRAVGMDMLFTSLSNEVEKIKHQQQQSGNSVDATNSMTSRISAMSDKIQSYKTALPVSSPVKQKNFKMGKVEIF